LVEKDTGDCAWGVERVSARAMMVLLEAGWFAIWAFGWFCAFACSLRGRSRGVAGPSFRGHDLSGVFGVYFPGVHVDWLWRRSLLSFMDVCERLLAVTRCC